MQPQSSSGQRARPPPTTDIRARAVPAPAPAVHVPSRAWPASPRRCPSAPAVPRACPSAPRGRAPRGAAARRRGPTMPGAGSARCTSASGQPMYFSSWLADQGRPASSPSTRSSRSDHSRSGSSVLGGVPLLTGRVGPGAPRAAAAPAAAPRTDRSTSSTNSERLVERPSSSARCQLSTSSSSGRDTAAYRRYRSAASGSSGRPRRMPARRSSWKRSSSESRPRGRRSGREHAFLHSAQEQRPDPPCPQRQRVEYGHRIASGRTAAEELDRGQLGGQRRCVARRQLGCAHRQLRAARPAPGRPRRGRAPRRPARPPARSRCPAAGRPESRASSRATAVDQRGRRAGLGQLQLVERLQWPVALLPQGPRPRHGRRPLMAQFAFEVVGQHRHARANRAPSARPADRRSSPAARPPLGAARSAAGRPAPCR